MADVGAASRQDLDLGRVDGEAEHAVSARGDGLRQGQPNITQPDDADARSLFSASRFANGNVDERPIPESRGIDHERHFRFCYDT